LEIQKINLLRGILFVIKYLKKTILINWIQAYLTLSGKLIFRELINYNINGFIKNYYL